MATIQQVITEKLGQYAIELTPVRLEMLLVDADLTGSEPYTKDQTKAVKTALLGVIAELLATPDIAEGGYSVKWDRSSVQLYCNQLRAELGMLDESKPLVQDKSYLW